MTYCLDNDCLHFQAFEQCLGYNALFMCEASHLDDITYYILNLNSIFIVENNGYHSFSFKNDHWNCESCPNVCKMKSTLHKIACKSDNCCDLKVSHDYCPVEYTTISTLPIPNELDDELASVYTQQLSQEIQLPRLLYPEAQYCGQGYKFNTPNHLTRERTGITIYTENAILEFKDHEGKCKKFRILDEQNMSCITCNIY